MEKSTKKTNIILFVVLVLIIAARYCSALKVDLYSDEAEILNCIESIIKTGSDTYGNHFPLFSKVGIGLTTYPFFYPMVLLMYPLIRIGHFRARVILQTLTILSCFLTAKSLNLWIKDKKIFWITLFVGLTIPWSFVQTNRIWDPTFVPLYFSLFFYFYSKLMNTANTKKKLTLYSILTFSSLVFLAIVYPPNRIPAVALWVYCFVKAIKEKKLQGKTIPIVIVICTILSLPLAYNILFNPSFNQRAEFLLVFKGGDLYKEIFYFIRNIGSYFSLNYLFITGDIIIRHSLPVFGILGTVSLIPTVYSFINPIKDINQKRIISMMLFIIVFTVLSVSLTNDYHPHTLRLCMAMVPSSILLSIMWNNTLERQTIKKRKILYIVLLFSFVIFFITYELIFRGVICF